jgi:putative OPT family oligopeptide transporter
VKLLLSLAHALPDALHLRVPFLPGAEVGLEIAPALIGVGYILGYRSSAVLVAGSALSALVLIPLIATLDPAATGKAPDDLWGSHVRYIGAGAVAAAGIATVLRTLPSMARSLAAVASGLRRSDTKKRDLPGAVVLGGITMVVLVVAFVPGVLGSDLSLPQRMVCAGAVAVLGLVFVTVASRVVGIVGVSSQPTSGITLVTLLAICGVFVAAGWTSGKARVAVLLVGAIVAIAASKAGDISQDLKTGQLVGATPAVQQVGQYVGAATACWAVAATLLFLGKAYGYGSAELPAPQATLMKTIVDGVLAGTVPWRLVLGGAGIALTAALSGAGGLAFAIGVYLPLASMTPLLVGGIARALVERSRRVADSDPGVLAASGLVAGEGLAGVVVAALVGGAGLTVPKHALLGGAPGAAVAAAVAIGVAVFLVRAAQSGVTHSASPELAPTVASASGETTTSSPAGE